MTTLAVTAVTTRDAGRWLEIYRAGICALFTRVRGRPPSPRVANDRSKLVTTAESTLALSLISLSRRRQYPSNSAGWPSPGCDR
jgi:hypothetical protein